MLESVFFTEESFIQDLFPQIRAEVLSEMGRAVRHLRAAGFRSGVLREEALARGEMVPAAGTLLLCGSGELLRRLRKRGFCAVGYSHRGNPQERFSGAPYVVQEPDMVDPDSYRKMYEREAGLPWTILQTPRCLVREFVPEDLEGIYALYDREARRFLEPPSEDRAREREILRAYIDRIYGLYGFGHWAVTARGSCRDTEAQEIPPGTLIGRVGFSAITSRQAREAGRLGIPGEMDADFGFLISPACRRQGIGLEVCAALLQYGFEELGFTRVRADAARENTASLSLLEKLGFVPVGISEGKQVCICDAECNRGV